MVNGWVMEKFRRESVSQKKTKLFLWMMKIHDQPAFLFIEGMKYIFIRRFKNR